MLFICLFFQNFYSFVPKEFSGKAFQVPHEWRQINVSPDLYDNLSCPNCIGFQVHFKVLSVISKILHGTQPGYLQDCLPLRISSWIGWAQGGHTLGVQDNSLQTIHHGHLIMVKLPQSTHHETTCHGNLSCHNSSWDESYNNIKEMME